MCFYTFQQEYDEVPELSPPLWKSESRQDREVWYFTTTAQTDALIHRMTNVKQNKEEYQFVGKPIFVVLHIENVLSVSDTVQVGLFLCHLCLHLTQTLLGLVNLSSFQIQLPTNF